MESMIELTASARAHAEKIGVLPRLQAFKPGDWVVKGDLIELVGNGRGEAFIVYARRVRIEPDGRQTLVLVLDHPPRPALR